MQNALTFKFKFDWRLKNENLLSFSHLTNNISFEIASETNVMDFASSDGWTGPHPK